MAISLSSSPGTTGQKAVIGGTGGVFGRSGRYCRFRPFIQAAHPAGHASGRSITAVGPAADLKSERARSIGPAPGRRPILSHSKTGCRLKSGAGIEREPDAKCLLPCRTFSSLQSPRNSSSGRVLSRKGLEFTNLYRSPRASLRYFLHDVKSPFVGRGALIPGSI